jgi:FkbM family methyltransferase
MRLPMSFAGIQDIRRLIGTVENPAPIILDRMAFRKTPYQLRVKNGPKLEIRPGSSGDRYAFFEVFVKEDYVKGGQSLDEGDVVIDVGANIGCFSLFASRMVGPTGRVFAIEPEEATFQQLKKNIALNNATNVTAYRMALGEREQVGRLHFDGRGIFSSLFSTVDGRTLPATRQEIRIASLRTFMDEAGIRNCDYLKLDCEGGEHAIVAGIDPDTGGRIDQITVEMHALPEQSPDQLHAVIQKLGFTRRTTLLPAKAGARLTRRPRFRSPTTRIPHAPLATASNQEQRQGDSAVQRHVAANEAQHVAVSERAIQRSAGAAARRRHCRTARRSRRIARLRAGARHGVDPDYSAAPARRRRT